MSVRLCLALLSVASLGADVIYEVRETVSGHKLMITGKMVRNTTVWIDGGRTATREGNVVQVRDLDTDSLLWIDHASKRFTRAQLSQVHSAQLQQSLPEGVRMRVVEAAVPSEWKGQAVERNGYALEISTAITGMPMAMEISIREWTVPAPPPDPAVAQQERYVEDQVDRELDALVQTMSGSNIPFLRDLQSARSTHRARRLPIKVSAQTRFKGEWVVTQALADLVQGQSIMDVETEILNLRREQVPPDVFLVPSGYALIPYKSLRTPCRRSQRRSISASEAKCASAPAS